MNATYERILGTPLGTLTITTERVKFECKNKDASWSFEVPANFVRMKVNRMLHQYFFYLPEGRRNISISYDSKEQVGNKAFVDDFPAELLERALIQHDESAIPALETLSDDEPTPAAAPEVPPAAPTPAHSAADELKKFKELLDMGAISQEEFDAKKKQLLGL